MIQRRILVAGGLDEDEKTAKRQAVLGELLGREVIAQGHKLASGCINKFDQLVATAAAEQVKLMNGNPAHHITSYALKGVAQSHKVGIVRQSRFENWELSNAGLEVPEPVGIADVVIAVGGHKGTMRTCNWARIDKKPFLPMVRGRGASEQLYYFEKLRLDSSGHPSQPFQAGFESLADIGMDDEDFTKEVVALAVQSVIPTTAFVIMAFKDDPQLDDALTAMEDVAKSFSPPYQCFRLDQGDEVESITDEILGKIATSAFCFVELKYPSPNVYFELGYAKGIGRPVVLMAPKGTEAPFDIKDLPIVFYSGYKDLKATLLNRLKMIAQMQGRDGPNV